MESLTLAHLLSQLMNPNVEQFVQEYCNILTQKMRTGPLPTHQTSQFVYESGRKYYKIISERSIGSILYSSRSVHAFVDKNTGEIYKAASWKSPAKHVRFNLMNDTSREQCFTCCDIYGSYLYLK
jgi:hypothetical protein